MRQQTPRYESKIIDGPRDHEFERVEVRWYEDGGLSVVCKSGKGPITVLPQGTGNYRSAHFKLKRRTT